MFIQQQCKNEPRAHWSIKKKKKKKKLRKLQYACITDFTAYPVLTVVRLLFSNNYTQKFAFSGPQNQPTNKTLLIYAKTIVMLKEGQIL